MTGERETRIPFGPGYTKEEANKQQKEIKKYNADIRKSNINNEKRGKPRSERIYVNPRIIKVEDARKYYYKQTSSEKDI